MEATNTNKVAVWEFQKNDTWLAFLEEDSQQIETAYLNNQQLMVLNDADIIDLQYCHLTNDTEDALVIPIRRTLLAASLQSDLHEHPMAWVAGEKRPCYLCSAFVGGYYKCERKACGYCYCVGCLAVQEYPIHRFEPKKLPVLACDVVGCQEGLSKGFYCTTCAFTIHRKCFVPAIKYTRCPRKKIEEHYQRMVMCARLPRVPEVPSPYYIFWRTVGWSYYFFGPGLHGTYVVGRIDKESIQILNSFKEVKSKRVGVVLSTVWQSFRKGEVRLKYHLRTTYSSLIGTLQLLGEMKKEKHQFIESVKDIQVIERYQKSTPDFAHKHTYVTQNLVIGMHISEVSEGVTSSIFSPIPPPTIKVPLLLSKEVSNLIPNHLIDDISEAMMEIKYSDTAEIECWENVFFTYIVSLIPVPGFKLGYSFIRMMFYLYQGNTEEVLRSLFGMISGLIGIITFFGPEIGLQNMFDFMVKSSDALSSFVDVLNNVLGKIGDFLSPITVLKESIHNLIHGNIFEKMVVSSTDWVINHCSELFLVFQNSIMLLNPSFRPYLNNEESSIPKQEQEITIPITCKTWLQTQKACPPTCCFSHKAKKNAQNDLESFQLILEKEKKEELIDIAIELFKRKEYMPSIARFTELLDKYQTSLDLNDVVTIIYFRGTAYYYINEKDSSIRDTKVYLKITDLVPSTKEHFQSVLKDHYREEPQALSLGPIVVDRSPPMFRWFINVQNKWMPLNEACSDRVELLYQSVPPNTHEHTFRSEIFPNYKNSSLVFSGGGGGGEMQWVYTNGAPKWVWSGQDVPKSLSQKVFLDRCELRRGSWFYSEDDTYVPYPMHQATALETSLYRDPERSVLVLEDNNIQRSVTKVSGGYIQFRMSTKRPGNGRTVLRGFDKVQGKLLKEYEKGQRRS